MVFVVRSLLVLGSNVVVSAPGAPLGKSELVRAVKALELKSVSSVFDTLADEREDAGSKVGLASPLNGD